MLGVTLKTLREWMVENAVTHRDMAKRLGTSQQNVTRWMGSVNPTLEVIKVIKEITKGEVDYESFHMNAKYEGDKRLVAAGLAKPSLLDRWVSKDE